MNIEKTLDQIHLKVTKNRFLQLFTAFTRVLLAIGFIPPSIPKIMYQPFTILPDTDPVGHYFNALYQTGYYYQFIGWGQIIAAIFLLIPRTSHIGALMFFPIILNIMVLTNSVGFKGTWAITILMFIASLYLVCWDYDRLKAVVFFNRKLRSDFFKYEFIWLPVLFALGGISAFLFFSFFAIGNFNNLKFYYFLTLAAIGGIFGFIVALHHRFMRIGDLKINEEKF
jgi:hypothetical protein